MRKSILILLILVGCMSKEERISRFFPNGILAGHYFNETIETFKQLELAKPPIRNVKYYYDAVRECHTLRKVHTFCGRQVWVDFFFSKGTKVLTKIRYVDLVLGSATEELSMEYVNVYAGYLSCLESIAEPLFDRKYSSFHYKKFSQSLENDEFRFMLFFDRDSVDPQVIKLYVVVEPRVWIIPKRVSVDED